jgi:LysM repeat protein
MKSFRWLAIMMMIAVLWGGLALVVSAQGPCGEIVTVTLGDTLWSIAQRCNTTVQAIVQENPEITNPDRISVGMRLRMPIDIDRPDPDPDTMTYLVRPPDTLAAIAERFGVTVEEMLEANPEIDDPEDIEAGQELVIPPTGLHPQVEIEPTAGPPGTEIQVLASDYPTDIPLTVGLGRWASEPTVSHEVTADDEGNVNTTITLPDEATSGEEWVVLVQTVDLPRVEALSERFNVAEDRDATTYTVSRGDTLFLIARQHDTTVQALLNANPDIQNPDQILVGQQIRIPAPADEPVTQIMGVPLIRLGTGDLGCNDELVWVQRQVAANGVPLEAALRETLALDPDVLDEKGLYNALLGTELEIEQVSVVDGTAEMRLRGSIGVGGVCELPRLEAQLTEVALQFDTVTEVNIWIDGRPLSEVLDLRG